MQMIVSPAYTGYRFTCPCGAVWQLTEDDKPDAIAHDVKGTHVKLYFACPSCGWQSPVHIVKGELVENGNSDHLLGDDSGGAGVDHHDHDGRKTSRKSGGPDREG